MKTLLLAVCISISALAVGQGIQHNDIVVQSGAGISLHFYGYSDSSGTYYEDGADAALRIPVQVEYGITQWLGAHVHFSHSSFFSSGPLDESTCRINDIGGGINLHAPWKSQIADLNAQAGIGFSKYNFRSDNPYMQYSVIGSGVTFRFALNPRFYFSRKQNFGLGVLYAFSSYNYKNALFSEDNGIDFNLQILSRTHSLCLTVFYNFHHPRESNE